MAAEALQELRQGLQVKVRLVAAAFLWSPAAENTQRNTRLPGYCFLQPERA